VELKKSPWAKRHNAKRRRKYNNDKKKCKNDEDCNENICINDDGHAKTFKNIWQATHYLGNRRVTSTQLVSVALGKCKKIFNGCIYTEWFDLDDPASDKDERESVASAHDLVLSSDPDAEGLGRTHLGIHRSCQPKHIKGDAQFQTTDGDGKIAGNEPGGSYKVEENALIALRIMFRRALISPHST